MTNPEQGPSVPPTIPSRTSSKRVAAEPLEKLENKRQQLTDSVREARKRLNEHSSYDQDYWINRERIAEQLLAKNNLQHKISRISFTRSTDEKDKQAWDDTKEAKDLAQTDAILKLDKKLFSKQAIRLSHQSEAPSKSTRRLFMKWFTKLPQGLGVAAERRDTKLQSRFKQELVEAHNTAHPEPGRDEMWCPILATYVHKSAIKAAHIFGYALGQDLMTEIFGDKEGERNELFSPKNGIMMHTEAEDRFDKGFFVIVPSVNDESAEAYKAWHQSDVKAYKIRVVDTKASKMNRFLPLPGDRRKWIDLEGQDLQFKTSHRPRARYLYYHYCVTMLRRSHHQNEHENILRDHMGKKFWGTPGPYLRKTFLLALVEELGTDDVLDGAENPAEEVETDYTLLAAANETLRTLSGNRQAVRTGELAEEVDSDAEERDEEYEEEYKENYGFKD